MGEGGGRESVSGSRAQSDPQKTEKAVNHRQNNDLLIIGSGDLSIAKQLVYSAIAVSTAVRRSSHKYNVRSTAVGEQLKQKTSPTF